MPSIPLWRHNTLNRDGDNYYTIHKIVNKLHAQLRADVRDVMESEDAGSPTTFLKRAFSESSSRSVYYAPRKASDGFPPRNNTLKDLSSFWVFVEGETDTRIVSTVSIKDTGEHVSLWGETKGDEVYPWKWIDEGRTYGNRFTGNPRRIKQNFNRDWHTQGYRGVFINKIGTRLRKKGWNVER